MDSYSFFRALGFREVHAMDISPYEKADIIFDLNSRDVPIELKNRFDYILDGGTTEHVFDYPQALKNIAAMLKVGGKIFHYIPTYGWTNHGYYSLSPSLLDDFYRANGFHVETLDIVYRKKSPTLQNSLANDLISAPDYRVYNLRDPEDLSGYSGNLRCIAQKIQHKDVIENPKQIHWYGMFNGDWLKEIWYADAKIEDDDAAIGIVGINELAQLFLDVLATSPSFKPRKVKAFFVDDKSITSFKNYPVRPLSEILNFGLKTIFLATFDKKIYETFKPLAAKNINIVTPNAYLALMK